MLIFNKYRLIYNADNLVFNILSSIFYLFERKSDLVCFLVYWEKELSYVDVSQI